MSISMISSRTTAWQLLVGLVLPLSALPAQRVSHADQQHAVAQPSGWGAVDGGVADTSGAPLSDVEVMAMDDASIHGRTGTGGMFRIDSVSAGFHMFRFRRVGIVPLTVSVNVKPGITTSVDAVVAMMPHTLARVEVQGSNGEMLDVPRDVADRMRNGMGTYLTAADVAKANPINTADVLRHVAGIVVTGSAGDELVYSIRPTTAMFVKPDANGNMAVSTPCTTGMDVFVDGAPMGAVGAGGKPLGGAINAALPGDIAAIEIYKDAVEIPPGLTQSACGAIYIWTKSR